MTDHIANTGQLVSSDAHRSAVMQELYRYVEETWHQGVSIVEAKEDLECHMPSCIWLIWPKLSQEAQLAVLLAIDHFCHFDDGVW